MNDKLTGAGTIEAKFNPNSFMNKMLNGVKKVEVPYWQDYKKSKPDSDILDTGVLSELQDSGRMGYDAPLYVVAGDNDDVRVYALVKVRADDGSTGDFVKVNVFDWELKPVRFSDGDASQFIQPHVWKEGDQIPGVKALYYSDRK